jgi:hypothetical protein
MSTHQYQEESCSSPHDMALQVVIGAGVDVTPHVRERKDYFEDHKREYNLHSWWDWKVFFVKKVFKKLIPIGMPWSLQLLWRQKVVGLGLARFKGTVSYKTI